MQYKVKVKNRTVKIWDNKGNYGWAKCHPEDKFDVGVGFKIAVSRIKQKLEIGDRFQLLWRGEDKKFCNKDDSAILYVYSLPDYDVMRFCYGTNPKSVNPVDMEYSVLYSFANKKNGDTLYIIEDGYGRLFCYKNLIREKRGDILYGV